MAWTVVVHDERRGALAQEFYDGRNAAALALEASRRLQHTYGPDWRAQVHCLQFDPAVGLEQQYPLYFASR